MIKTLIGIRLRSVFSGLVSGRKKNGKEAVSKGKLIGYTLIYLYLAVVLVGMFVLYARLMAPSLVAFELDWFYFAIFNASAFAVVFVLSIFETKGLLFECKDNELLLSLPIKPKHIVISRILTVLIFNYLGTALILFPTLIVYLYYEGKTVAILGTLVVFVALPLLATALASGVGYLVALLSRRFKHNSFIPVAISIAFLVLYFFGYSKIMSAVTEGVDFVKLSESFSIIKFFGEVTLLKPLYTVIFFALSLAVAYAAYKIISASYIAIVTASGGGKKKEYKASRLKSGSAFVAMVKKEFSLFLSSATYILNGGLGLIFTAAVGVLLLIKKEYLTSFIAMFAGADVGFLLTESTVAVFITAILVLMLSMTMISSSALSLEGDRLWIIKTMPVSAKSILLAKTMPALLMSSVAALFASVCCAIALKADALTSLFIISVPTIASIANSLMGTAINAFFPKFKFDNETQVVKQSLAVMLSLCAAMLIGLLCIGAAYLFGVKLEKPMLGLLLMLVLNLLVGVASYILINGPLSRKIEKMSV